MFPIVNDKPMMKCFTFDCTVRIPVSLTATHCECCQKSIDGQHAEEYRTANYHRSNAWGR